MATYTVASAKHATLTASTVDTVTISSDVNNVEVLNRGADVIYFTVDGTTPTVAGDNTRVVASGGGLVVSGTVGNPADGVTVVKLISASATAYSVSTAV